MAAVGVCSMQVFECTELELDMTRDMDLTRKLLLWIEDNPELDGMRWLVIDKPEEIGVTDHSIEEIQYHMRLLSKASLVEGRVNLTTVVTAVSQLTWAGHEFLDNIKPRKPHQAHTASIADNRVLPGLQVVH